MLSLCSLYQEKGDYVTDIILTSAPMHFARYQQRCLFISNANFKCYAVRVFNFIYSISGLTTPRRFLCTAGVLLLFPSWSSIAAFCRIPECLTVCHRIVTNRGNALLFHVPPLLSFRSHLFSKLISLTELLLSDEKLITGYS